MVACSREANETPLFQSAIRLGHDRRHEQLKPLPHLQKFEKDQVWCSTQTRCARWRPGGPRLTQRSPSVTIQIPNVRMGPSVVLQLCITVWTARRPASLCWDRYDDFVREVIDAQTRVDC